MTLSQFFNTTRRRDYLRWLLSHFNYVTPTSNSVTEYDNQACRHIPVQFTVISGRWIDIPSSLRQCVEMRHWARGNGAVFPIGV